MDSDKKKINKSGKADWFVQGALSKIGDIFDKLTGRGWNKASSLSASELTERLKGLLDSEVKDLGEKGRFVPHIIKLKMQWNKFSTDSEDGLKKLEFELLTAAIDHINDNLYHTYKPLKIEVKPDYFTEGIKFLASFDEFGDDEAEAEINVTAPQLNVKNLIPETQNIEVNPNEETYITEFTVGEKRKEIQLKFDENKKRIGVGRTKENDLSIEDASISKIHAALVLNPQKMLLVADTGSTNGTFINGQRIAYGRAFPINEGDKVKFGNIEVFFRRVPKPTDFATQESYAVEPAAPTEAFQLNPQATQASLPAEAYQVKSLPTENVPAQPINDSVPKLPEFNFTKNQVLSENASDNVENAPQNEPIENSLNPTEPRIKLNFDE